MKLLVLPALLPFLVSVASVVGDGVPEDGGSLQNSLRVPELMVITRAELVDDWTAYVDWRNRLGRPVEVATVESIETGSIGRDRPERIRNFIRDTCRHRGIEYFLLGGDSDSIPPRMVAISAFNSAENAFLAGPVATDLYYSDLDGDWDANGNGVFGELDDGCDLQPDVKVGRIPVRRQSDVRAWTVKLIAYEMPASNDYQDRVMLSGEVAASLLVLNVCSSIALETQIVPHLPASTRLTRIYDRQCARPDSIDRNSISMLTEINEGYNIILDYGHGNWRSLSALDILEMPQLSNITRPSIYITTECNGCEFALASTERVACEEFVLGTGGGVAYLGNTEFGVGFPALALFYDLFFDRLYTTQSTIGDLVFSTLRNYIDPSRVSTLSDYRWQQFVLVLMGDPSMNIWSDKPKELTINGHDKVQNENRLRYLVTSGSSPVGNALVTVYSTGHFLYEKTTDQSGQVEFPLPAAFSDSEFTVTASKPGYVIAGTQTK